MTPDGIDRTDAAVKLVDALRGRPERRDELIALLREQASIYQGLGTRDAERLRGYVMASFEAVGLPDAALPFVLEELETGIDPYPVAAAARALRGAARVPDSAIRPLGKALRRIAANDDYVDYEAFAPTLTPARGTTALDELVRTIAALGPRSAMLIDALGTARIDRDRLPAALRAMLDRAPSGTAAPAASGCCCASRPAPAASRPVDVAAVGDLLIEDQAGKTFSFDAFFAGRPGFVSFFYTRCMNPDKCSLTITKLARLQRRIRDAGLGTRVNVAAFTYDPAYDRADRLHAYGIDRGMRFDARNKLLRTLGPFEPLKALFDLNVGFGPATVNRHRVEALVLDQSGRVRQEFARVLWSEDEVLGAVAPLVE